LGKARAFLGLLLLHVVDPSLSADMYAMMTCAGISLQGEVEWRIVGGKRRPVHVKPDPDAARRKALRRFLEDLTNARILKNVQAEYARNPMKSQDVRILDHVPPAGIVCYSGIINAKKIKGKSTSKTYALTNFPSALYPGEMLSDFIKVGRIDSTNLETCQIELSRVYNALKTLTEANKLGNEHTFATKLQPYLSTSSESAKVAQATYVLACFNQPRGLFKLLPSAVRLTLATIRQ